jgi:KR domain/Phosphopantetheine attachment site
MVLQLARLGSLKLPSPTTCDYSEVESAFRQVQSGDVKGPLILSVLEKSLVNVVPRNEHPLAFNSDVTYVLAGGLGGLGRALAVYMAQHGAKNIVFLSRSGDSRPEAQTIKRELTEMGVQASIFACDITDRSSVALTVEKISQNMPPVKGMIHAAMVVRDGTFKTMTYDDWTAAARPKIEGTWNLHELLPKDLDFFLTLSSVSGIVGNRGQSSYSAGNSYQDGLMFYRQSLGLPATTIDLGAISGMGWLEENKEASSYAKWMQRLTINPDEFFAIFKSAITGYSHGNHPLPSQVITALGNGGLNKANVADLGLEFWWLNDSARFAYLRELDLHNFSSSKDQENISELKDSLKGVTSVAEASDLVTGALAARLARGIMIPAEEIDVNMPISSYGVDSLVAADFRNWCFKELKADIQIFEFLSNVPITALARQIAEKSALVPDTVAK